MEGASVLGCWGAQERGPAWAHLTNGYRWGGSRSPSLPTQEQWWSWGRDRQGRSGTMVGPGDQAPGRAEFGLWLDQPRKLGYHGERSFWGHSPDPAFLLGSEQRPALPGAEVPKAPARLPLGCWGRGAGGRLLSRTLPAGRTREPSPLHVAHPLRAAPHSCLTHVAAGLMYLPTPWRYVWGPWLPG